MNLKAFFIGVALVLGTCTVYSQRDTNEVVRVTVAPLNLLDTRTGVIQLGVQKRFTERLALALDYGFRCNVLPGYRRSDRKDYGYYKAKAELKYFLQWKNGHETLIRNPYLSLQGLYFPQHYRKYNDWLVKDGKNYHYEYSDITRRVTVASFILGNEEVWNRVVMDYYFGLGVRRITLRHDMTGAVEGFRPEPKDWGGNELDLFEGTFYRPHIALGFKVGYSLRK